MVYVTAPKFALCEAMEGLIVEAFDPTLGGRHLTLNGWSRPNVNLFSHHSEVDHLRDQIIN